MTIFKSGYLKIMRLFYEEKQARLHLREIARLCKINVNSASRFLGQLEKLSVLSSEKDGSMKKYSIQPNDRTFIFFTYFDTERFRRLPDYRRDALAMFVQELPKKPVFVYLFGSTARGDFREESDCDIILVANRRIRTDRTKDSVEAVTTINIQTFQLTFRQFLKELRMRDDNVIQSALSEGYPLMNHLGFYRVYYREALGETAEGPFIPRQKNSFL